MAMVQLTNILLSQFYRMGITINKSIADTRLIKSASKPVFNDKLGELRQKHCSLEGRLDKNGMEKRSPVILNRTGPSKTTNFTSV
jgi:hypothetical protein